ncbi:MAG: SpoIIE family protein phosphatase [Spirochaetales bacterium]|nr:SpoIIE family protein phosphatase [Spirochaetales bacterium]
MEPTPIEEIVQTEKLKVLKVALPEGAASATSIFKLATQFYFVFEDALVKDFIEDLKRIPEQWAIGVVDKKGKGLGVIVLSQFQARLSQPFAYDVLGKREVHSTMVAAKTFPRDKHLLTVADHIESEVSRPSNSYYLLENPTGKFAGIFSSKDLLIEMFRLHRQDLKLAVSIQAEAIPECGHKNTQHLEFYGWNKMAKGVGGDYWAMKEYQEGRWVALVCDVSGKGMAAGLITTALAGMFSLYDFTQGLEGFITCVNNFVLQTFKMEKYLTGVFLDYSENDRRLKIFDMGHGHLRLIRNKKSHAFSSANPFLGFTSSLIPQPRAGILHPGDLLCTYTDGFIEQQNIEKQEFGIDRFEKILEHHASDELESIAERIHTTVKTFRGDQPRGDDLTLLLLRVKK